MSRLTKRSFAASIILHCLLLFGISFDWGLVFDFALPQLPKKQAPQTIEVEMVEHNHNENKGIDGFIIDKPEEESEGKEVETVEDSEIALEKEKKKNNNDCERSFGGIGVTMSGWSYLDDITIHKVHKGYPADQAGLQAGDIIREIDGGLIRGEVGSDITLIVKRGDQKYQTTFKRGKICIGALNGKK